MIASISTPSPSGTRRSSPGASGRPSAAISRRAGSTVITTVRRPARACPTASAAETVVFPTPPEPHTTTMRRRGRPRAGPGLTPTSPPDPRARQLRADGRSRRRRRCPGAVGERIGQAFDLVPPERPGGEERQLHAGGRAGRGEGLQLAALGLGPRLLLPGGPEQGFGLVGAERRPGAGEGPPALLGPQPHPGGARPPRERRRADPVGHDPRFREAGLAHGPGRLD